MQNSINNLGLEKFDLSDYKGLRGKNFFKEDKHLQRIVKRYSALYEKNHKEAVWKHLEDYGDLVGGVLDELTEKSHKEGKYGEIQRFDKVGNRIESIEYCFEQKESRRISYEHGIVNLDFHSNWKHPFTHLHRYALAYLCNMNGEGGVTCPLAMTDGMIYALKEIGTEEQKKKYLPLVAGEKSKSHFMAGQYVTERVGGSNVKANRTIARKLDNGKWQLVGEKWFCSNPGDLWVTTAKIEGTETVGLFLVPRIKDDGNINGFELLRKKGIIGSKGKVTAEIIYNDVEAEAFGRPTHGLSNLVKYIINISRLHVGVGTLGNSRRALMEALEYSKWRTAYKTSIKNFPIYASSLTDLVVSHTALLFSYFRLVDLVEKNDPAIEILLPLMKYKSSSLASSITHGCIMCLGGNGILDDFSVIPRMHNDSIINETWEGTHFIISDHVLHALGRTRKLEALLHIINQNLEKAKRFKHLYQLVKNCEAMIQEFNDLMSKEKKWKELNRLYIIEVIYKLFALSELLEQASFDETDTSIYYTYASIFQKQNLSVDLKNDFDFYNNEAQLKAILNF